VCFLCAWSEGSAATLRHDLYQLTNESHLDVHSLYGFLMQRLTSMVSARVRRAPLRPREAQYTRELHAKLTSAMEMPSSVAPRTIAVQTGSVPMDS
jgi:hypothetical protein